MKKIEYEIAFRGCGITGPIELELERDDMTAKQIEDEAWHAALKDLDVFWRPPGGDWR